MLQDKELLCLRLQTATSPRAVAALRAKIRAEEEARAVAHQVAVRAVAAACAQEEDRLAALPVHPLAAPVPEQVQYFGQSFVSLPSLFCASDMLLSHKGYWVVAADPAHRDIGIEVGCKLCMLLAKATDHS